MFGLKNEEILTCLLLIVVGYFIARMFSRSCNGFRVGVTNHSHHLSQTRQDDMVRAVCNSSTYGPNTINGRECCRRFNLRCPQPTIGSRH